MFEGRKGIVIYGDHVAVRAKLYSREDIEWAIRGLYKGLEELHPTLKHYTYVETNEGTERITTNSSRELSPAAQNYYDLHALNQKSISLADYVSGSETSTIQQTTKGIKNAVIENFDNTHINSHTDTAQNTVVYKEDDKVECSWDEFKEPIPEPELKPIPRWWDLYWWIGKRKDT